MGIKIIKGGKNKTAKVKQGVLLYVNQDGSVKAELILNEKVIDLSSFLAIILLSEVEDIGGSVNE